MYTIFYFDLGATIEQFFGLESTSKSQHGKLSAIHGWKNFFLTMTFHAST